VNDRRFLERGHELAELDQALAGARDGTGCMALVAGEPGIGKSSLVARWLQNVHDVRLLSGACDDLVTPRPLGPFRDMVRGTSGPLARAMQTGAAREDVLAAMQDEFANPLRPTVVVIEDLQWADEATLDAVRFLARRIVAEPTVLIATVRDDLPAQDPTALMLGELTGPAVRRLVLAGLSVAAIAELTATSDVSPEDLHDITGGNPFFVTELLAAPGQHIPVTVRDAVSARLRRLDDTTRAALEHLAIAPGGLELHLAGAVVPGGIDSLAEAERRGLVLVTDGRIRYAHEITRRAVVAECPAAQLAGAHAKLLAVLDPTHGDPARLLHHAISAGDAVAICRHAPAAARAAAQAGAHRDAAAALAQALRYPEQLDPVDLATILTDHARELLLTDQLADALEQAERAVAAASQGDDPEQLGLALTVLADARYWGLRGTDAAKAAQRAVDVLRPLPLGRPLARAASTLAFTQVMANRFDAALTAAEEAVSLALGAEATDVLPHALTQRGTARAMLGDADGLQDLQRALTTALEIGHHEHVVAACVGLVSSLFRLGRLDEAERAMEVGLQHAEAHDLRTSAHTLHAMRSGLDLSRGNWDAASERLEMVVGAGGGTGWGDTVATALLGRLRARQDDPDAVSLLDRAWRIAIASGEIQRVGPAGAALAEWAWLTGEHIAVRERVQQAIDTARRTGHRWYLGELLRYHRLADPDAQVHDDVPEPWASSLRGDWQAAATGWEAQRWPYERALELLSSGEADATEEGILVLDRLGAVATARLGRRRLKELGVRRIPRGPRPETRANPAGLTARQAEILALVASGATNVEIADQLVLSVRTVDHHVSAALAKLGVSSRRDAAALARQLGLATPL
jgi:DNA-binding CsgD family transcriptional regulator/tetratricopeptide (TPR) repeat protein